MLELDLQEPEIVCSCTSFGYVPISSGVRCCELLDLWYRNKVEIFCVGSLYDFKSRSCLERRTSHIHYFCHF
ncbi:hypothetical protein SUGI_0762730 [Cryptomeria japonica]|nr:hypothetical protein SUGI_0762730 [Cryptomeria japonica]